VYHGFQEKINLFENKNTMCNEKCDFQTKKEEALLSLPVPQEGLEPP
jgi:hypothetical protein